MLYDVFWQTVKYCTESRWIYSSIGSTVLKICPWVKFTSWVYFLVTGGDICPTYSHSVVRLWRGIVGTRTRFQKKCHWTLPFYLMLFGNWQLYISSCFHCSYCDPRVLEILLVKILNYIFLYDFTVTANVLFRWALVCVNSPINSLFWIFPLGSFLKTAA